jgi:hypothetical protein
MPSLLAPPEKQGLNKPLQVTAMAEKGKKGKREKDKKIKREKDKKIK